VDVGLVGVEEVLDTEEAVDAKEEEVLLLLDPDMLA
jgi:hypothetical protein